MAWACSIHIFLWQLLALTLLCIFLDPIIWEQDDHELCVWFFYLAQSTVDLFVIIMFIQWSGGCKKKWDKIYVSCWGNSIINVSCWHRLFSICYLSKKKRKFTFSAAMVTAFNLSVTEEAKGKSGETSFLKSVSLRPAGGVNHPDSVSAKVGKLAAKKALRWLEGSILSNSRTFQGCALWFSCSTGAKCAENTHFPLASN